MLIKNINRYAKSLSKPLVSNTNTIKDKSIGQRLAKSHFHISFRIGNKSGSVILKDMLYTILFLKSGIQEQTALTRSRKSKAYKSIDSVL